MPPTVSVIIPTYNRQPYLEKALASVLQQTYSDYEIIVVDDASTDGTSIWLQSHYPQARLIQLSTNQGAAAARNTAIRQACGSLIAFLDSDDQWLPGYLLAQVQVLHQHPKAVLAYSNYIRMFSSEDPGIETVLQPSHEDLVLAMLVRCFIHTLSQVVVPRWVFDQVGYLDDRLRGCHDWEFYLRLFAYGVPVQVPLSLVRKLWLPDSIVTTSSCQDWLANGLRVYEIFFNRPENSRYVALRSLLENNFRTRVEKTREYYFQMLTTTL